MSRRTSRAFTLIELLIVVAIIAILASIAVPNFLEAQVRSKVSRAKADIRSLATAVESYYVDWSDYPVPADELGFPVVHPCPSHPNEVLIPSSVTTPIAYIAYRPLDPFTPFDPGLFRYSTREYERMHHGDYHNFDETVDEMLQSGVGVVQYFMTSKGPDKEANLGSHSDVNTYYDPTNGTLSRGDIVYWGPGVGFPR
jgi:prepilin-type N-terminal cleavage/methylation domain-containing protein